ncbi:MAG: hypothetical protein AABZ60_19220 [Planctomycetota bacterium]
MKKTILFFFLFVLPLIAQTEQEFLTQQREKLQQYKKTLEKLRTHLFKKEIKMGVQSQEEFRRYLDSFLEKEIPRERNQFLSQIFSWLGLAEAGFDYRKKMLDLFSNEAVAYYDIYTKSFFFLSKDLQEDQLGAIVLHELQHGLQDQYYPLEPLFHIALKSDSEDLLNALRFLLEGEASMLMNWCTIQKQYPDQSVPELLHQLLSLEIEGDSEVANPQSTLKIQDYFMSILYAPYLQGMFALSHAYKNGNWKLVDQLFSDPPTTTEQLLHFPSKYLQTRDYPTHIIWDSAAVCEALQKTSKTVLPFHSGQYTTFGEFGIYSIFHHLLQDRKQAKLISEGWDGDLFQSFDQEKASAFFWILSFDQETDVQEAFTGISSLVEKWKEQAQPFEYRISQHKQEVILTASAPEIADLFHQQLLTHYQTQEDTRSFHMKIQTCPACHSIHIVPILYGMPDQELSEKANRGEVFLGGCCIEDTHYHCKNCKKQW